MEASTLTQQLVDLLQESAHAHHQAFIETDGVDPESPLFYADYLHKKLAKLLNTTFTKSELVYLIVLLEKERASKAPKGDWIQYYADFFTQNYD